MSSIYVTSDTHFNHTNIIKYCERPFTDVTDMNESLISNWNKRVKKNDIVLHLGDFGFGNSEQLLSIRRQLHGIIFLLLGNHDRLSRLKQINVIILSSEFEQNPTLIIDTIIFSHRPISYIRQNYVNVHGHIHEKDTVGRRINVSTDVCSFTPVSLRCLKEKVNTILNY